MEILGGFVLGLLTGAGIIAKIALMLIKRMEDRHTASQAFQQSYHD